MGFSIIIFLGLSAIVAVVAAAALRKGARARRHAPDVTPGANGGQARETAGAEGEEEHIVRVPSCLTVVLCTEGLPSLEDWNAEMARQGLDVAVLPTPPELEGQQRLRARALGGDVDLRFAAAPMEAREDWFPLGQLFLPQRKGAALLGWWRSDERAGAAAWSLAASLANLSSGDVFEGQGAGAATRMSPWAAYERADALLKSLPDGSGDYEFDVEASTAALIEKMLRDHDEMLKRGEDPGPHDPPSTERNL
jgi:hypothetical protein